jgi:hypothetical protein
MPHNPNDPLYATGASRISAFRDFDAHRAEDAAELRRMRRNFRKRGEGHQAPGERKHKWNRATHKVDDLSVGEVDDRLAHVDERRHDGPNYMFVNNLKSMHRGLEDMLAMIKADPMGAKALLDEHPWAVDHIATSADDTQEVHNWMASMLGGKMRTIGE